MVNNFLMCYPMTYDTSSWVKNIYSLHVYGMLTLLKIIIDTRLKIFTKTALTQSTTLAMDA